MGILIRRSEDGDLYRDTYEEAQRIIRISEEVRISMERVSADVETKPEAVNDSGNTSDDSGGKLTTAKLAAKLGMKTAELNDRLVSAGLLELRAGKPFITDKGRAAGGEFRMGAKFGPYFLWPESLSLG